MEIIDLDKYNNSQEKIAIALGNFDGVHLAHQKLLMSMIEDAKKLGFKSSVLLFENHTREITKDKSPELLTSEEEKLRILKSLGVERVFKIRFDNKIMRLSPEDFISEILYKKLNVASITVGFDYRFGYKASGNIHDLKRISKDLDIKVNIIKAIYQDKLISSTQIRQYIKDGNIKKANEMLGRNYSISGKVISGNQVGRELGFPTANIQINSECLMPKFGIYAAKVRFNNKEYLSATNIGITPTFNNNKVKLENHILDFKGDIYDIKMETEFIEYIRDEKKFNRPEDLIRQMEEDIDKIKRLLK